MWFYYRLLVAPTVQSNSIEFSIFTNQLVLSISCSEYYTSFCACSVMFYFIFTLSYMLSTFQVLMHTCATSSHDVGSGSQHPDHA